MIKALHAFIGLRFFTVGDYSGMGIISMLNVVNRQSRNRVFLR